MTIETKHLRFKDMAHAIALTVDDRFYDALPLVFPYWPYDFVDEVESEPLARVEFSSNEYTLTSPYMDSASVWHDPLNTICELIVEIAWDRVRQNPEMLSLHGAAVAFGPRLVVFPATRRAGKSTLTVALAAAGHKLFTDDFLPVKLSSRQELLGVSNGISPRLRLPVPDQFGERSRTYMASRSYIANRQYRYVTPRPNELAPFGDTMPLGALVYLERDEGAKARLTSMSKADALKDLITQNFAREINTQGILRLLDFAATELPIYRLTYSDVDDAIECLEAEFATWETEVPRVPITLQVEMFERVYDREFDASTVQIDTGEFQQARHIYVAEADGKRFLTGQNGKTIHLLNDLATAIWTLLSEPTSLQDAIEIVHAAFPDQQTQIVARDVTKIYKSFATNGLIVPASDASETRSDDDMEARG